MRRWIIRIVGCLAAGAVVTVAVAWGIAMSVDPRDGRITIFREQAQVGDYRYGAGVLLAEFETTGYQFAIAGYHQEANIPCNHDPDEFMFRKAIHGPYHERNHVETASFSEPAVGEAGALLLPSINDWREFNWVDRSQYVQFHYRAVQATGWPRVALASHFALTANVRTQRMYWPNIRVWDLVESTGMAAGTIDIGEQLHLPTERVIPFQPVWSGFFTNSAIYAAGVWSLFCFVPLKIRRAVRRRRGRCLRCGYDLQGDSGGGSSGGGCPECGWGRESDS